MTTEPQKRTTAHIQVILIFAVFAVPLALAALMYYGGGIQLRASSANNGVLLEPFIKLADEQPESPVLLAAPDKWIMLYANAGDCDAACKDDLYRLRQIRLMLGKDMSRVARVFLHGDSAPDTVFLEDQHPGLKIMADNELGVLLEGKRPAELAPGGNFLIDPLGNLVMYFSPELDPKDVVDDLKRLLRLSHIG